MGFDSLPDQLVSKSVSQGFCFNILCVGTLISARDHNPESAFSAPFLSGSLLFASGETGIGKSTLMNTLFNTTFENEEASHYEREVQLRPQTYDLQESNVNLKLTIVHTVGFGDQINKEDRCRFLLMFV